MNHRLYGRVVSSDQPLEFHGCTESADLVISQGTVRLASTLIHDVPDPGGARYMRLWQSDGRVVVAYDGWRFELGMTRVTYESFGRHESPFDLVVERVVVPLVRLFHEQTIALHGAAAIVNGRAFVFIGESGAGKSTTARLLAERGAFACDDLTLIDEHLEVHASASGVRSFEPLHDGGRELYPGSEKQWYPLPDPPPPAAPIGMIVHLIRASGWSVRPLSGATAVVTLLSNAFDLERPPLDFRKNRLAQVASVARQVQVVEAAYPGELLPEERVDQLWARIKPTIESGG